MNRQERHHQQVSRIYQDIRNTHGTIITTDYVLDEVYTLLFKRVPFETAQKALEAISEAIESGYVSVIWMTPERFEATQKLRRKFHDKPNISFTDLSSMVVMRELGISEILTGDAHFTHVGMGFILLP